MKLWRYSLRIVGIVDVLWVFQLVVGVIWVFGVGVGYFGLSTMCRWVGVLDGLFWGWVGVGSGFLLLGRICPKFT